MAQLLANDRPGPDNESAQSMTVTDVVAGPFTHGTVTFVGGIVTYLPDEDFVGNATIPYTVCDNGTTNGQPDPLCSTGGISVKVTQNHPPVVDPPELTTVEDTPIGLTLTGSDPDGQAITFVVTTQPSRGVLSGTPPALTYTPAPDANGTDSFTFAAHDGNDQSLPATVTIAVTAVNDPPVPQPDTVTARATQPVTVPAATLAANDDAGPFDEAAQTLTVTAVTATADSHGTVVLADGNVTYTPEAGFIGTGVIGYTVCDNGTTAGAADPLCATSTLSITANRPPVANAQSAQTSLTTPVAIALDATDPDGDALTYTVASSPTHGTLTGTAPNLTYTAAAGFVGADSFTFTASDAFGSSNPATVTITVADVPAPTLGADAASVRSGQSIDIDVLANDTAGQRHDRSRHPDDLRTGDEGHRRRAGERAHPVHGERRRHRAGHLLVHRVRHRRRMRIRDRHRHDQREHHPCRHRRHLRHRRPVARFALPRRASSPTTSTPTAATCCRPTS